MILFWIIVIVLIVYLVRGNIMISHKQDGQQGSKTALDILKERYAKGEVTKKEFETMKKGLI